MIKKKKRQLNRYIFLHLFLFLFIPISFLCAQKNFHERADSVVTFFRDSDRGKDYFFALAKLKTGIKIDRALAYLDTLFERPQGDAYWMLSTMALYVHGRKNLPDQYKNKLRDLWTTYTPLCRDTENERVLYHTSLYLAVTRLDDSKNALWFNGKSTEENKTDALAFLRQWFREATERGMEEFDSPTRTGFILSSMYLLYDFARDEEIKKKAEIMIHWLLADFAVEYLDGMYCGAHGCESEYSVLDPRLSPMSALASLYFADIPLIYASEQLLAALSTYKMPELLVRVALDRREAYIHTEIKRSKEFLRGQRERRREVYTYTYMTDSYAMGSLDGGLIQPLEQHSWDVSWKGLDPATSIFGVQPIANDTLVAQFLSQDESTAFLETATTYPRYSTFNKNTDGSPYERLFQQKNTLIGLYSIPAIKTFPFLTAFFPKALDTFIPDSLGSKWIFCKTPKSDVYIAYYPLKSYFLLDEENGKRLISPDRTNGFICQAASKKEAGSFEQFMTKIKKTKIDLTKFDSEITLRCTTINGDKLEFTHDGARKLNGKEIQFDKENLFKSKWMQSKKGSGVLTITDGVHTLSLDMKRIKIEEK